jgi:uncharacterized protein (DUF885 family)
MTQRTTPIFQLADAYCDEVAARNPQQATSMGIPGYDHLLTDHGPEAAAERAEHARATLAALNALTPTDDLDRLGAEVMRDGLETELALHDSGEGGQFMSVIWSTAGGVRNIFEMMPHEEAEQRATMQERMTHVGEALASWRRTLEHSADNGHINSRRQILAVAKQCKVFGEGALQGVVKRVSKAHDLEPTAEWLEIARQGDAAFTALGEWMESSFAPRSEDVDGVGAERYALWARSFTGATLDPLETYQWGLEELERITQRMVRVAQQVIPDFRAGSSFIPVVEALDADPQYQVIGREALLEFLGGLISHATTLLDGAYFDIEPRIRTCEVRIAPEGSASAAYYTSPTEDLSRPGITWYPIVKEGDVFPIWHDVSTWFHEGIPGHHLQLAIQTISTQMQTRYARLLGGTSGQAEGWALYAERLMDELGQFPNPGYEMGYLSAQALRAARVVVDIGMHLHLQAPAGLLLNGEDIGGRTWDAVLARDFMMDRALQSFEHASSEVDRYLGLPGQAISYKVGERYFLEAREAAKARLGDAFDLKKWHTYALDLGGVSLDTLQREMAAWQG